MAASMDRDESNMHGPIVVMPRPPSMIRPDVRVEGARGVNILAPIPDRFNILGPE